MGIHQKLVKELKGREKLTRQEGSLKRDEVADFFPHSFELFHCQMLSRSYNFPSCITRVKSL